MDFGNAITMMKQGIKVTRTSWGNQDEYVYLDGGIFMKNAPAYAHPIPIVFYSHEVLATDWEVIRVKMHR